MTAPTDRSATASDRAAVASGKRGAGGLPLTAAYLAAMLLLYVGEHLLFESLALRASLATLALALIAVAIGGRLRRMRKLHHGARPVERSIVIAYVAGVGALLIYALQADFALELLGPHFGSPQAAQRWSAALATLWVVVWVCAITPLIFVEISYAPMDTSRTVELRRIRRSWQSGLVVALTAALTFTLNFIANELNTSVDLSYFKTTHPSESSKKMVQQLSEPLRVVLFFPGANEVLQHVRSFFEDLHAASPQLRLEFVDQVLEPKLAKELGATENGVVVFVRGTQKETLTIGDRLQRAKSKLKRLDADFQQIFLRLLRTQKVAYFTVGHEERAQQQRDNAAANGGLRDLRKLLEGLNYRVRDLGLADGLGSEIPGDATMVLVIGPKQPFLPAESATLAAYLRRGGRALVMLDPDAGVTLDDLLNPFGLKYVAQPLAVEVPLARVSFTQADRQLMVTNRFGTHPSVGTLSRHSTQLVVVMAGAGYLEQQPPASALQPAPRVSFTVHSLPLAWNDANNNFALDPPGEQRKLYELAAAVEITSPKPSSAPSGSAGETRMIVVADSDLASDGLLFSRAVGNRYLLLDAFKWLGGDERLIGETASEEDIPIAHTRQQDQLWFYLTIFGMPALVLGFGLLYTQRRRRMG
ncbi:MAG: Gldg family protein [Proteobacteria bacterium]|nr:Gldg family protein [Pseudomonadota bacterium]